MARCCQGSTCACLIQSGGAKLVVSGAGTAGDPYVLTPSVSLTVSDTSVLNLTLTGAGTTGSPWVLSGTFAATAKLDDLPDVNAPSPANTEVLGWDSGTSKWTARAATTAASGSVVTDTSLDGDGSGGDPLAVIIDPFGFLASGASGISLSTSGRRRIVRHFSDAGTRAVAATTPDLNTLTMLDDAPGRIDYWNGSVWVQQGQFDTDYGSGELLAMSGSYAGGRLIHMVRQVAETTDGDGLFDALSVIDLTGYAGVLSANFQPTGGYFVSLEPGVDLIQGHAYDLSDGSDLATVAVTGVITAWLY